MAVSNVPAQKLKHLCTLLARHGQVLFYVFKVLLPCIVRDRRRPVIFSRYSGLGDIICTIPAALELRKRHPGARFIYNCHPDFAPIPRMTGAADCFTSLEPIGILKHWYGFLLEGFYHFAHGDDLSEAGCQEPMVTEFCRQFDVPLHEEHPELSVSQPAKETALQILDDKGLSPTDLILIHPGPSWPVREWPRENWAQLIASLSERGFKNVGQLGVGRHVHFGKVEIETIPGTVSLLDAFTVEECIAAIGRARLFIGIDSGLLHIAAGTRTPSVGLFGMTLPEHRFSRTFRKNFVINRIECAGCEHRKPRLHWVTGCPYDIKCMKMLSVDDVLQACLANLTGTLVE